MTRIIAVAVVLVALAAPAWGGALGGPDLPASCFDAFGSPFEGKSYAAENFTTFDACRSLAEQGNAKAQFILGVTYNNGTTVPQDYAEAVRWYRKAADQGNADAQYRLGIMYVKGHGISQDQVQAHKWFNLAAALGEDLAAIEARNTVAKNMTLAQIAEAQRLAREWWAKHRKKK